MESDPKPTRDPQSVRHESARLSMQVSAQLRVSGESALERGDVKVMGRIAAHKQRGGAYLSARGERALKVREERGLVKPLALSQLRSPTRSSSAPPMHSADTAGAPHLGV